MKLYSILPPAGADLSSLGDIVLGVEYTSDPS
jgi:hypothetical protein